MGEKDYSNLILFFELIYTSRKLSRLCDIKKRCRSTPVAKVMYERNRSLIGFVLND